jgi:hypothetical protein
MIPPFLNYSKNDFLEKTSHPPSDPLGWLLGEKLAIESSRPELHCRTTIRKNRFAKEELDRLFF